MEDKLSKISHFKNYPSLMPWVGNNYARARLLIIGESHYLEPECTCHLNSNEWYSGKSAKSLTPKNIKWMNTRNIITNGINNGWKERSKLIYKNIDLALRQTGIFNETHPLRPFDYIAYLNFFQRPAQSDGASIKPDENDINNSRIILNEVIKCLNPTRVVFCTKLGAKKADLKKFGLENPNIQFHVTAHPASAWRHRSTKKDGPTTSRQSFIDFLKKEQAGADENIFG